VKAAFRRLSENGENYSVPPLRRQPPAVYGEHGVVYVHLFTVSRPARKTKGHVMLQSLNHLTLAVSDLQKSVTFWHELLGLALHARWNTGAYLTCGDLWVCLSYDEARRYVPSQESDYTHYAFTVAEADFEPFSQRLEQAGVTVWKQNKSEGASFYFLDPDGHKLELHVGSLAARLAACREKPYAGMVFTSDEA